MGKADNATFMDKLKTNVGWWFLIGMVALIVLRLLLPSMVSGGGGGAVVTPPPAVLDPKISENTLNYMIVDKVMKKLPDPKSRDSTIFPLVTTNMFDPMVVKNAKQLEDDAKAKAGRAKTAYDSGDTTQARDLLLDALAERPGLQEGDQLMVLVQKKLKGDTGATSATATQAAKPPAAAVPAAAQTPH